MRSAREAKTEAELREWYAAAGRGELFPEQTPGEVEEAAAQIKQLLDALERK